MQERIWATAQLYGEKKICIATLQLYCKREGWKNFIAIVLQEKGNCIAIWGRLARNCITILVLYCNLEGLKGWKIVLQYRELYCNGEAESVLQYEELYCKRLDCKAVENCIAIQLVYCD